MIISKEIIWLLIIDCCELISCFKALGIRSKRGFSTFYKWKQTTKFWFLRSWFHFCVLWFEEKECYKVFKKWTEFVKKKWWCVDVETLTKCSHCWLQKSVVVGWWCEIEQNTFTLNANDTIKSNELMSEWSRRCVTIKEKKNEERMRIEIEWEREIVLAQSTRSKSEFFWLAIVAFINKTKSLLNCCWMGSYSSVITFKRWAVEIELSIKYKQSTFFVRIQNSIINFGRLCDTVMIIYVYWFECTSVDHHIFCESVWCQQTHNVWQ